MAATVEIRLVGGDFARVMGEMRMWLDSQRIVPRAFRQSTCPGGLALHVEFNKAGEASDFAGRFGGRVLGTRPAPPGEAGAGFGTVGQGVDCG